MDEKLAWDIYYAQICSWGLHPGWQKYATKAPTIEECAEMADAMLEQRKERWPQ